MPVKGAGGGGSSTTTHRLANRAQRRAGERRAPGSRSQNAGMQGQAGGSMAVRGPGRRIDASNTPFNRMRHSAAREKQTHSRRAMVQARGKPGQHASAEGVPAVGSTIGPQGGATGICPTLYLCLVRGSPLAIGWWMHGFNPVWGTGSILSVGS